MCPGGTSLQDKTNRYLRFFKGLSARADEDINVEDTTSTTRHGSQQTHQAKGQTELKKEQVTFRFQIPFAS